MEVLIKNKRKLLISTLLTLGIGFIALSILVYLFPPGSIDLKISLEIQEHHTLTLDEIMTFISWFGTMPVSLLMVVFTAFLFYICKYRREAWFTLLTLSSGIVSTLVKMLINRPRPSQDVVRIIEITRQQSFPSGHTLFYTVFFGFLIIIMRNVKSLNTVFRITVSTFSAILIILIPFSRIYLGAHWFTDVLGGAMLGILCLSAIGYLYLPKKHEAA